MRRMKKANLKLLRIEKQSDGTMKMTTSGLHDGFPGYEMFVSRHDAMMAIINNFKG